MTVDAWRIDKWQQLINSHLPRGEAISRNPDSNWQKWARSIATVCAELDEKIEAVVKEWMPLYTLTRLADWITTTTSKNDCGAVTNTLDEQRARVLAKLRLTAGGMDGKNGSAAAFAYLEAVAERLGYDVTITKSSRCVIDVQINSYNGGVACVPRRYGEPYGELYGDCGYALLQCIFHKYVRASWNINFIWPEPPAPPTPLDPYFASVVSLLHFDEEETVTPVDVTGRVWTLNGGESVASPALFSRARKFGPYGSGATQVVAPEHADLDMGTGNFTLEFSLYSGALSQGYYSSPVGSNRYGWGAGSVLFSFQPGSNTRLDFYEYADYTASGTYAVTFGNYTPGVWTRYALVRSGTTLLAFVDGVLVFTRTGFTASVNFGYQGLGIGFNTINSQNYDGIVDEFRLTKGVARYASDYEISDVPFPDSYY